MDLTFNVCKQTITRTDTEKVVNLSDNYLSLNFTFQGTDWDSLSKFVLVHHKKGVTRLELTNGSVTLSDGLLYDDHIDVSLYGVDDPEDVDYRITANKIRLYLGESGYTDEYTGIAEVIDIKTIREMDEAIDSKADADEMESALAGKSDVGHTHTKSDISDFSHTHTKSEISDFSHTHTKSEISDFEHNHDDLYYRESEVDTLLNTKSDVGHLHDDRYYTENETDVFLNGKVDKVNGKGLSTNDFTDTYKDVLDTFDGDWSEVIDDNLDTIIAGVIDAVTNAVLNRVVMEATPQIIQSGDTSVFKAYVIHNGLPVYNQEVSFYEVFDPVVITGANPPIIQTGETTVLTARVKDENDGSLVKGAEVEFYIISEE